MADLFIPITGFVCVTLVIVVFAYLHNRAQTEIHRTFRAVLDSGTPLTPELADKLRVNNSPKNNDLRKGVIITTIGLAIISAGFVINAFTQFLAVAVFPLFVGFGFLLVWKLNTNRVFS